LNIIDYLFSQYAEYPRLEVILELVAVAFGILSVLYSKRNNILVFPTGIISTCIFVYLLYKWGLIGDMLVNGYYFIMSIYGWIIWTKKDLVSDTTPISLVDTQSRNYLWAICLFSMFGVYGVYYAFDKLHVETNPWLPYVDITTTAIFFGGMWLMAKRKLEHWYFWIVANTISIPLYFIKGYSFTSIQYIVFLVLAILGYLNWRKIYQQQKPQL